MEPCSPSMPARARKRVSTHAWPRTSFSPKVRISTPSVRRCDWPRRLPSIAAIAGVAGVLVGGRSAAACKRSYAVARVGGAATGPDARVAAGWDEHRASRRRCQDCRSAPRMRQRRPGGPFPRCRAGLDVERDGGTEAVRPRTPAAEAVLGSWASGSQQRELAEAGRARPLDPSTSNASAGHRCWWRGTSERGQSLLTAAPPARSGLRCSRNRSSRGWGSSVSISTAVPGQAFCR